MRQLCKHAIILRFDFDEYIQSIMVSPSEMTQVIINLLSNSALAIREQFKTQGGKKGDIVISTKATDSSVLVSVADNGTGVPNEIRDKIFDPFFTTHEVGEGTGQGLSICQRIVVENHDGTIEFQTELGKGTTFVITLPR